MRIGVLSDSHGSVKWFRRAIECLENCDMVVHLGDVLYHGPRNPLPEDYNPAELAVFINKIPERKVLFVRGNCDADVDLMVLNHDLKPRFRTLQGGKLLIGLVHGDQFSSREEWLDFATKFRLNVLLLGHTHRKIVELNEGVLFFNPGSLALPKDGSKSVGLLEVEGARARALLYDLEKVQVILEREYDFSSYL